MATLLVMGFDQMPPDLHLARLWPRKTEKVLRAGCLRQWDIVEIHPDRTPMGRLGGRRSRDVHHRNARVGRWLFFRLHIPAISIGVKGLIEQTAQKWPQCGREIAMREDAGKDEREPIDEIRSAFYVDFSALPNAAKVSLLSIGEATLNEQDARNAIKHKWDQNKVARLFEQASV